MSSPLVQRSGAVDSMGPDAGVPWHYGKPSAEQASLAAGAAFTDLSNRGVVTVTGPDRLSWLDTLTTQALRELAPGESRETLILSPHGHVENALHVVDDGETTWLTVEPGATEALVGHLQKMRFMLRVEIADRSCDVAVLGFVPGGAAETEWLPRIVGSVADSADVDLPGWTDPWPATVGDGFAYNPVTDDEHPGRERPWREQLIPRAALEQLVGGADLEDVPMAGSWASEALRIAALRPRCGFETDHRTIPHEVDWLRTAVHLHKGCYRGQETVARVHNLGRPPRRLVFLHLDGSDHELPERGAEVVPSAGGRAVGRVTSVAHHYELGPIALAVVKRSVPTSDAFVVDGVAAAQQVVVQR